MSKPWLRLWDKTLDSPKVQAMSGDAFKGWCNLLCLANRQPERGILPTTDVISFSLRMSKKSTERLVDELIEGGFIDLVDGKMRIHDWEEWQPEWDSSTDRTREYRERKRSGDVTHRAACDVTVTSQKRHQDVTCDVTLAGAPPGARSETETETDKDQIVIGSSSPESPPAGEGAPAREANGAFRPSPKVLEVQAQIERLRKEQGITPPMARGTRR